MEINEALPGCLEQGDIGMYFSETNKRRPKVEGKSRTTAILGNREHRKVNV